MKPFVKKFSNRGFTLLETLLYISLTALTILAVAYLFSLIFETRIKQKAISEVEQQGNLAIKMITQAIRNSKDFDTLTPGNSNGLTLSVATENPNTNPTIFSLSNGALTISMGSGPARPLTSDRVIVSNLLFQNLGSPATTGTIQVRFTLNATNPSGKNEYNYQETFYASASAR
jgi:type II secretory pathway pseudopilin PulG